MPVKALRIGLVQMIAPRGGKACCTGTPEYRSSDGLNWKPR